MSDFSELIARDPLSLSEKDITTIVESIRKQAGLFKLGNAEAGRATPRKNASPLLASLKTKISL